MDGSHRNYYYWINGIYNKGMGKISLPVSRLSSLVLGSWRERDWDQSHDTLG